MIKKPPISKILFGNQFWMFFQQMPDFIIINSYNFFLEIYHAKKTSPHAGMFES